MKARIPKGTYVWGTFPAGDKIQGVTRVVRLKAIDKHSGMTGKPAVVWAGTGGYWHYALVEDVEIW